MKLETSIVSMECRGLFFIVKMVKVFSENYLYRVNQFSKQFLKIDSHSSHLHILYFFHQPLFPINSHLHYIYFLYIPLFYIYFYWEYWEGIFGKLSLQNKSIFKIVSENRFPFFPASHAILFSSTTIPNHFPSSPYILFIYTTFLYI